MEDQAKSRPCPGINGKCVEKTTRMTKRALCCGCERGYALVLQPTLQERTEKKAVRAAIFELKQAAYNQLHTGLPSRPPHLQGITDSLPICSALGLEVKDFVSFHKLAIKAAQKKQMAKLFDFVGKDGFTFDAIYDHTARFQTYLAQAADHPEYEDRVLALTNPVVLKVYTALLELQVILTTHVYGSKEKKRDRIPPAMGYKGTRWGHPMVLFSKGNREYKSVPRSAFTNQAMHCDFQPEVANANARVRGRPVPYSVIINCSPEDAIIRGCGLSPLHVLSVENGVKQYPDLPEPVCISIPTGCMVVFRGDYVHGGTSYNKNHTRLFMGMHLVNDVNGVNTTCLEEPEKLPPCDIKGESTAGVNRGNRSHRKRVSEATGDTQKKKTM